MIFVACQVARSRGDFCLHNGAVKLWVVDNHVGAEQGRGGGDRTYVTFDQVSEGFVVPLILVDNLVCMVCGSWLCFCIAEELLEDVPSSATAQRVL